MEVHVYPILNQEVVIVAKKLANELFLRFSMPEQLCSEQGDSLRVNLLLKSASCYSSRRVERLLTTPKVMG